VPEDPTTVLRKAIEPPTATAAEWTIHVVSGPDQGKTLVLDGSAPQSALVGSSPSADLPLIDKLVSRRHLSLDPREDGLHLADLESKNGTFIGTVKVASVVLGGPQVVRIGDTVLGIKPSNVPTSVRLAESMRFGRVVGASAEMRRLYPLCAKLSASDVPVVIEGETGTGKEVLAEALHEQSGRANGPFVVFDCTAVLPTLVESALFGHERGAFTGAVATRKGVFEQAHGGTLLIDEIGDLDISLQAKLLRVLERSEIQRVGGDRFFKVDVRVLAATRRDLDREVSLNRFRDDLYFRLAVARIALPSLRERKGDIPVLTAHFWKMLGGDGAVPLALLSQFESYGWPGNVRELRNAVARRIALGELASFDDRAARASTPDGEEVKPASASTGADFLESVLALALPLAPARQRVIEEFERRYVARVLEANGGNVVQAAAASGIARRYFYKLRARLGG